MARSYQPTPVLTIAFPSEENDYFNRLLKPGENVYSYIMGVTAGMPPGTPLIVDGTDGTGSGRYTTQQGALGGTWNGTKAIIIHLDNSAAIENLQTAGDARYVAKPGNSSENLLSPEALGPKLRLLEPAVEPK